jgi:hypothetical protein
MKNFTVLEIDDMLHRQDRRNTLSEVQQEVEKLERLEYDDGLFVDSMGRYLRLEDVINLLNRLKG